MQNPPILGRPNIFSPTVSRQQSFGPFGCTISQTSPLFWGVPKRRGGGGGAARFSPQSLHLPEWLRPPPTSKARSRLLARRELGFALASEANREWLPVAEMNTLAPTNIEPDGGVLEHNIPFEGMPCQVPCLLAGVVFLFNVYIYIY